MSSKMAAYLESIGLKAQICDTEDPLYTDLKLYPDIDLALDHKPPLLVEGTSKPYYVWLSGEKFFDEFSFCNNLIFETSRLSRVISVAFEIGHDDIWLVPRPLSSTFLNNPSRLCVVPRGKGLEELIDILGLRKTIIADAALVKRLENGGYAFIPVILRARREKCVSSIQRWWQMANGLEDIQKDCVICLEVGGSNNRVCWQCGNNVCVQCVTNMDMKVLRCPICREIMDNVTESTVDADADMNNILSEISSKILGHKLVSWSHNSACGTFYMMGEKVLDVDLTTLAFDMWGERFEKSIVGLLSIHVKFENTISGFVVMGGGNTDQPLTTYKVDPISLVKAYEGVDNIRNNVMFL